MASQGDYSVVANIYVALMHKYLAQVPPWEQSFIPIDKIPEAAGVLAKAGVDGLDAYRATEKTP
jgi:hypothetical protein